MKKLRVPPPWVIVVLLTLALLQVRCTPVTAPSAAAPAPVATGSSDAPAAAPTATPAPLKLLKVEPVKGYVGDPFTVTAESLPPDKVVELVWGTVDGGYATTVSAENVVYDKPVFSSKRVSLGRATTDAQGRVSFSVTVPEDYGELHDIYAVIDGTDVAKGGFQVVRSATIAPTEGPVGTPITITVKGIGAGGWERSVGVLYDNKYTGWVSAVTTRGTVTFQVRAAGPVGQHIIELRNFGQPYLNLQQAPTAYIATYEFAFTVTEDAGPPPNTVDRPDESRVARLDNSALRTTASNVVAAPGVSAALEPASGPILSDTTLQATGLRPNAEVELFWITARGNRNPRTGSRWSMAEIPLLKATADARGELSTRLQVPDELGGWHMVQIVQGEEVLAEVSYLIEPSLVAVTPQRVKVGEPFTVQVKGVGWTELDNGIAVTYDNAYIGYACGFNSNGDVTIPMVATGGPGTHLIDIYPMIYKGEDPVQYLYRLPQLSALQDHPGLALGYRLPIFRLAIEVVE